MTSRHTGQPATYRITTARTSLTDDVRGRQRRYIASMLFRTLCVVMSVVLWQVSRPAAIAALVLGMLLPYVAVVIANAGRENAPGLPDTFVVDPQQPRMVHGEDPGRPEGGETSRKNPPVS